MTDTPKIHALPFYSEWAGHPIDDLQSIHSIIQAEHPEKPIVYLAGDSSLDNKVWVPSTGPGGEPLPVPVPSIYKVFLKNPKPKPDVAFWINHVLGDKATALNTAVEASLLRQRDNALLPHDEFIRDHIGPRDVLIVSVGANDIALSPNASTMRHMMQLAWLTPLSSIESGTASSLKYFKASAGAQPSWADTQLKALGYGLYPRQLQAAIKKMYEQATRTISIEGTIVIPCPLFEAMDGKTKEDYVARVEPSVAGGKKMASQLSQIINGILSSAAPSSRTDI
ncbi:hypothetical protein LTR22_009381 [Elasticomyces elasticus]|nr:hypothetical protein LTR22_009381 [Elasticomyces elasticus]KAK4922246.1 hypothetical protein LTR49_010467 [Elasticomyces elasticus]KAK5760815.1 hypothetical protein LTS12_008991 [Elasticomyces elasticus]